MDSHHFAKPTSEASRAPCPALNALANHGYLPRDGKNIGVFQLIGAIREVYNISIPLSTLLTTGALVAAIRSRGSLKIDLHDLAIHNLIEHDSSLAHDDAAPGAQFAPTVANPDILHRVLLDAPREAGPGHAGIALGDFARARVRREHEMGRPLSGIQSKISQGEAGLAWLLLKDDKTDEVDKERLRVWWLEERLDESWWMPRRERPAVGYQTISNIVSQLGDMMKQLVGKTD